MMIQWTECKEKCGAAVLLFRLGDFYEAFEDDAKILSQVLDITLTKRHEIPMAGIPHHAAEAYIDALVSKGYRVAIAEQTEDPKVTKGIVKREVVRMISPGTSLSYVPEQKNNYFTALTETNKTFGLAVIDLTTGEFRTAEFDTLEKLLSEIFTLKPSEILTSDKFIGKYPALFDELKRSFHPLITFEPEWKFEENLTEGTLKAHFNTLSLDGFGLKGAVSATKAAGALLAFLRDGLSQPISHVRELHTWSDRDYLLLDRTTQRNLELTESLWDGSKKNTLLEVIDFTETPMGGRLLVKWVKQPLLSVDKITARQEAVKELIRANLSIKDEFSHVRDLERLIMKVSSNLASPRDLAALKVSLEQIPSIKSALSPLKSSLIRVLEEGLSPLKDLVIHLDSALVDEPPLRLSDGGIFKTGFNAELDELFALASGSKEWLARYQTELKEVTGIKTLKVGYTKISGFYIEVSRGQAENVPTTFHRKQTLTNAERFLTPELKQYEEKILGAEEQISRLEINLFIQLKESILPHLEAIYHNAHAIAHLDALLSLAIAANQWGWVLPTINDSFELNIESGRHPVIEAKGSEPFIPNDIALDQATRLMLITGPNMAGKSTYIRQNALIVILAQLGSYVPANKASIGLIDKLFTRIGASDDLTRGQSTFMVEMTETANILHNATDRSLVILDEIGRGTSTYDGISIAWSVAEFLLTEEGRKAKTLFATHFWELTKLESRDFGAKNFTVAVHETTEEIKFLRKIIPGGTDKSYGIHVAKLAGLPASMIERAKEILSHLEENANRDRIFEPAKAKKVKKKEANSDQLVLF